MRDFVLKHEESRELLRGSPTSWDSCCRLSAEGKAYLTIAVGCTGGRHRSVALVEELRPVVDKLGLIPTLVHRDLDRE